MNTKKNATTPAVCQPKPQVVPTEMECTIGTKELFGLTPDFSGEKIFCVPDDEGNRAIFRAVVAGFLKTDGGKKKMVNYVAVYLEQVPDVANTLHALPEYAREVSAPLGQIRCGEAKPAKGMSEREFGYRRTIVEYLHARHEEQVVLEMARMQEFERAQREAREHKAVMMAADEEQLAKFAREGGESKLVVRSASGTVVFQVFRKKNGCYAAKPLFVNQKHASAAEIRKLIENGRVYLGLDLIHKEVFGAPPEFLAPFYDGLRALHAHLRRALEKRGLLEDFLRTVTPAVHPHGNGKLPPQFRAPSTMVKAPVTIQ